jgi:two-component system, sensor histidine kinase
MKDSMSVSMKKKILLVEDNIDTQLIFKIYLRETFDLEVTNTGENGLKLLNENKYDLLILDINLPGKLDGSDVLQEIKNNMNKSSNISPVLVVTAYAMKEDKEKFISQGADDYLSKPVNREDFMNKVNEIIASRG